MNIAHNLFLLTCNLNQLHDKAKIIELFIEGMTEEFKPAHFYFIEQSENEIGFEIEIKTQNSHFGFIRIEQPGSFLMESKILVTNAVQMLSIILERLEIEMKLHAENKKLELIAFEKNVELEETATELKNARNISAKLNEDLTAEIEKRIHHEKEIKESEDRFSIAFKSSPAPLVISEIETGLFTDVNSCWVEMLGYSREEQIGITSKEVGIWKNPSERDRIIKQYLLPNSSFKDQYIEFNTKNGGVILALWSAETIIHKGKKLMLSMIHDITEQKQTEKALKESESRFRKLAESAPMGIIISDRNQNTEYVNQRFTEMFGYTIEDMSSVEQWWTMAYPDEQFRNQVRLKWTDTLEKVINNEVNHKNLEFPVTCKDGTIKHVEFRLGTTDELIFVLFTDVTEKNLSEQALHKINWMLSKKTVAKKTNENDDIAGNYGDLTQLNTDGLILDSVGENVLKDISDDYFSLMETSSAIYEKNGDYAMGIFSSGWCRLLDQSSRKICSTDDNKEALASGKWYCHESCWNDASRVAIETGKPTDIECSGGIRLYALPIFASNKVIGAINFGYGDPPRDKQKLASLSEKYNVPVEVLVKKANEYESRPQYIIDTAKDRLQASARLIGEIVNRKITEKQIIKLNEGLEHKIADKTKELRERINELERFQDATIEREFRIKELRVEIEMLKGGNRQNIN
jgi:PAS domain S-box-containing protein